jgi:ferredoxin
VEGAYGLLKISAADVLIHAYEVFDIAWPNIHIDITEGRIDFSKDCDSCGICVKYCAYGAPVGKTRAGEGFGWKHTRLAHHMFF